MMPRKETLNATESRNKNENVIPNAGNKINANIVLLFLMENKIYSRSLHIS